ncbi:hypothetical protein QVD17_26315 [Tagetes erecta]|uniref:Uncharacterized protein n=1 Tax=Tagetes erecta TaxID=13708 RepID=A0AAD8KAR3_TARER|nr:hypothetical protein QVD17_26315 [Tagetes erecta]
MVTNARCVSGETNQRATLCFSVHALPEFEIVLLIGVGSLLMGVSIIKGFKELSASVVGTSDKNKVIRSILMTTCWFIWLARIEKISNNSHVSLHRVLDNIKLLPSTANESSYRSNFEEKKILTVVKVSI